MNRDKEMWMGHRANIILAPEKLQVLVPGKVKDECLEQNDLEG